MRVSKVEGKMKENGKGAIAYKEGEGEEKEMENKEEEENDVVVGVSKAGQRAAHRHLLSFITVPVRPPKTESLLKQSLLSSLDSYHGPTHGNIMRLLNQ